MMNVAASHYWRCIVLHPDTSQGITTDLIVLICTLHTPINRTANRRMTRFLLLLWHAPPGVCSAYLDILHKGRFWTTLVNNQHFVSGLFVSPISDGHQSTSADYSTHQVQHVCCLCLQFSCPGVCSSLLAINCRARLVSIAAQNAKYPGSLCH